jgi:hypothetical protein
VKRLVVFVSILVAVLGLGFTYAQAGPGAVYVPLALKPEATPTQIPTPTVEPTPIPPTPVPKTVVVKSSTAYRPYSGSDSLYIDGEVQNNTGRNVAFVKINSVLRNAAGAIVNGEESYADIERLSPGMTSPFSIILSNVTTPWDRYELTVTWTNTDHGPIQLEVKNTESYFDGSDAFHVRGTVRNQTNGTQRYVQLYVTMYDVNNVVIGTEYEYTNPTDLAPGQEVPFDVEVYFWNGKPDRSRVARFNVRAYQDW